MSEREKKETTRKRWWQFIIYPESAPEDFLNKLKSSYSYVLSPLHDKDINEAENEPKKPHFHCIMYFDGKKSYNEMLEITKEFNAPIPQPVKSPVAAIQYLIHKNDPNKYQYKKDDIKYSSDIDIEKYFKLTSTEEREIQLTILNIIQKSDIYDYDELQYCLRDQEMWEEFDYIVSHTLWCNATITAKRCRTKEQLKQQALFKEQDK